MNSSPTIHAYQPYPLPTIPHITEIASTHGTKYPFTARNDPKESSHFLQLLWLFHTLPAHEWKTCIRFIPHMDRDHAIVYQQKALLIPVSVQMGSHHLYIVFCHLHPSILQCFRRRFSPKTALPDIFGSRFQHLHSVRATPEAKRKSLPRAFRWSQTPSLWGNACHGHTLTLRSFVFEMPFSYGFLKLVPCKFQVDNFVDRQVVVGSSCWFGLLDCFLGFWFDQKHKPPNTWNVKCVFRKDFPLKSQWNGSNIVEYYTFWDHHDANHGNNSQLWN